MEEFHNSSIILIFKYSVSLNFEFNLDVAARCWDILLVKNFPEPDFWVALVTIDQTISNTTGNQGTTYTA